MRSRKIALLLFALGFNSLLAAEGPNPKDFSEVTKGTQKFDGLFTLYRTNETLYAEIKPGQFNQPLLSPIAIARGLALAGQPLNFGDEWNLFFRRTGDKVQLLRRNIHYKAPEGTPLEKAVKQNYVDSVLMAVPIVTTNLQTQGILIDLANIFMTDFAELGLGTMDRNRSTWYKIKTFPNNIELEVEATFGRGGNRYFFSGFGDDGVADSRGITLVIHYSLAKLPDWGYKPRLADNRVGHFLSATKDFGSNDPDTYFVRQINRWRLEKADSKASLSPPKKQIVWWVEDTVPHEYRPYVEQGILEWNKAFEKIGFRNALGVRWQNERDDFDPEDINYCTFRWITTSSTFAMSGLRANPLDGEMIDGDVIFDASWIRAWKEQYAFLVGTPVSAESGELVAPLAIAEIISPIMAMKNGFGLALPWKNNPFSQWSGKSEGGAPPELVPADWTLPQVLLRRRFSQGQFTSCQFGAGKQHELSLAAISLADEGKADPDSKLPEDFLGQAIKEVVMHEVGHSLGLRHNFKASSMLNADDLNDTSITRVKGNTGSVMDYNPINIVPKGQKQGDYASTTIGPYDYWAIEYAYKPIDGDGGAELKKIAARSPEPDLLYGTDEDLFLSNDPQVNAYDLGSDPLKYAQSRIRLAAGLLKDLDSKIVRDDESWVRLRRAFSVLLGQYGNGAYLATGFIGGQSVSRDRKGGQGSRDPIVPTPGDKQRDALKFVSDEILSDHAFRFSPTLLRRITKEQWYHWGSDSMYSGGGIDYPINDRILGIQRIVLNHCFEPGVLTRLQNQELQSEDNSKPLNTSEVFRTLTDTIWSELSNGNSYSAIRRNLQREHLRRLSSMVLGQRRTPYEDLYGYVVFLGNTGSVPADAKSLARLHLSEIDGKIAKTLESKSGMDETTRAHLSECHQRAEKVLKASLNANEP